MYQLHAEIAVAQLSKNGEELCGDKVEVTRTDEYTTVVVSDGLGSGVKANILATLTTKIASSMLKRGIPLEEVVQTIAHTLPVCRERKIAYSTLHIIKIRPGGEASVVEFDSPESFLLRNGQVMHFPTTEKLVADKTVKEGSLLLQENDFLIVVSDGVIHSGIGGLLRLGWNWEGISSQLKVACNETSTASDIAENLLSCCNGYYLGRPGDDSTVVAIKLRRPNRLAVLTGPPGNDCLDEYVVKQFMATPGKKAVCGGTTSSIVSRITGKEVTVDLSYHDPHIPPIGTLDGIDLVTEGVLTLTAAIDRLDNTKRLKNPSFRDGATELARLLLEADIIEFFAGTAVNPAHHNPNFPVQINIKNQVLNKLKVKLEAIGKQVVLQWF